MINPCPEAPSWQHPWIQKKFWPVKVETKSNLRIKWPSCTSPHLQSPAWAAWASSGSPPSPVSLALMSTTSACRKITICVCRISHVHLVCLALLVCSSMGLLSMVASTFFIKTLYKNHVQIMISQRYPENATFSPEGFHSQLMSSMNSQPFMIM